MKFESKQLIDDLSSRTKRASLMVKKFRMLELDELNFKKDVFSWSILECIEHLNLYGDFYLPEIERSIMSQRSGRSADVFTSGLLGNYFANLMKLDADGKMKKMKSPPDKNPMDRALTVATLDRFLKQQERLLSLLEQAKRIDLTRAKTAISLTRMIRLRLGDTFRFFIYHIERHVFQAERIAAIQSVAEPV